MCGKPLTKAPHPVTDYDTEAAFTLELPLEFGAANLTGALKSRLHHELQISGKESPLKIMKHNASMRASIKNSFGFELKHLDQQLVALKFLTNMLFRNACITKLDIASVIQ